MRLLRREDDGGFSLAEFYGTDIPKYAILSHTWGADHEEVNFRDVTEGTGKSKAGYHKLTFCAKQARKDKLQYFWVDTCCIDKSSSSELSEAINSMFSWYSGSVVCYVYLWDVVGEAPNDAQDADENNKVDLNSTCVSSMREKECVYAFENWTKSRWFSRGWTLQELIASKVVKFYSREWWKIGKKSTLSERISRTTGIPKRILEGESLHSCPVAQRMSWASQRETKREEDRAYCLLGIFGINMPLIYGEGKRSFIRLQWAILDQEEDYSIFAWSSIGGLVGHLTGLLASSPADFLIKAGNHPRILPQIPEQWLYKHATSGRLGAWMPRRSRPVVRSMPYYAYLSDMDYGSIQSYVPSRGGSTTGERLPDCLSVKTPREPVRVTSRGLHLFLPVIEPADPRSPSIAWTYCLYQGHLLCVLLQQTNGSTVFARHSPAWLTTVDAKYLKEFKMHEIYCHASGSVTPMEGISGSLHPLHIALGDLGREQVAAERGRVLNGSSDGMRNIDRIQKLISELRHSNLSSIVVQDQIDVGWLDSLKVYLENRTASSWDWAPLNPPRRPCTADSWHVEWECICGDKNWEQAPREFAQGMRQLIYQTRREEIENLRIGASKPSTSEDAEPILYVFLVVGVGNTCRVSQIALDGSNSSHFFERLRKEYFRNRGILRSLFSVYRFSHCDYCIFLKPRRNLCSVTRLHVVPNWDSQYRCAPRPLDPTPAVLSHEITMKFYPRNLFKKPESHIEKQKRSAMDDLLQRLPKGISALNEDNDAGKEVWGLHARERVSLTGVTCYFCIWATCSMIGLTNAISSGSKELQTVWAISTSLLAVLPILVGLPGNSRQSRRKDEEMRARRDARRGSEAQRRAGEKKRS